MPKLTIVEAQDAWLQAKAENESWRQEFMAQWYAPQIKLLMALAVQKLKNLTPEAQRELQQAAPDAWNRVMKEE